MTRPRFVLRWVAIVCVALVALVLIDWGNPSGWRMAIASGPLLLAGLVFPNSLKRQRTWEKTTEVRRGA